MNKSGVREFIPVSVFLLLILLLCAALAGMPAAQIINTQTDGIADLRGADFEHSIYTIRHNYQWESWAFKLYAPQDITEEIAREARVINTDEYLTIQFATHRTALLLMPDKMYGVSMKSADYSMRIFIDGEKIDSVGVPADTKDKTVPRTADVVYYFSPKAETVEIVIQAANFVHNEGAYPPIIFIGSQKNIERKQQTDSFMSFMIIGTLLMAAVHHLALFMLNRRRKTDFIFGVCCFLFALMTNRLIPFLFPEYNWFFAFRLEYIVHYATFAAMAWLFHTLMLPLPRNGFGKAEGRPASARNAREGMPKTLHIWVVRIFWGICAAFALSVLVFDTVIFSGFMRYFHYISIAFALYIMFCFAIALRNKNIKNALAFAGAFVMGVFAINDIALHMPLLDLPYYPGKIFWGMKFTSPVGMAFFVCCYSLLLAIDYAETQQREEMLAEHNEFLDNLNRTKTEFLQNISHKMKTPLTVISVHIQQAAALLKIGGDIGDDGVAAASLARAQEETMRLSRLTDNTLRYASIQESKSHISALDIAQLLTGCAEGYRVLLEKRGNALITDIEGGLPAVRGNADLIIQTLANLLTNANRHTSGGCITVKAERADDFVAVTVSDTGSGVDAEILPRLFERGVTNTGTGFGLTIAKSAVESLCGTISAANNPDKGAAFTFTIPVFTESGGGSVE